MRSFPVWIGTLAIVGLLAGGATAQSFDQLVPDSTVLYISIENMKRTSERFEASALHGLWNDPAMQAFLEKPLQQWSDWSKKVKEDEGFSPGEIFGIVEGQFVIALTQLDPSKEDDGAEMLAPVILAEVGGSADKLRALIQKVEEDRGEKFRRQEEEFMGVTLVHYLRAGEGGETTSNPGAWFLDGGRFGMASTPEHLKRVLSMGGEDAAGSLAELETYKQIRGKIGERPEVVLYVGVPAIMQALTGGDVAMPAQVQMILAILGLETMKGFGAQLTIEREGLAMKAFIAIEGEKEGMMKFLDAKNSALTIPRWVPGDAVSASVVSIDWATILTEVRKVANKIQPGAAAQIDGWFEMLKGATGVDLEQDFFGSFGQQVTMYNKLPEEGGGMGPGMPSIPPIVLSFSLNDKEKFENALNTLLMMAAQSGVTFDEQDYLGVKLRAVQAIPMIQPAIAVLPDQFLFGMSVEDLKDVVRRYGKDVPGLVDGEDYMRSARRLPEGRIMVGFGRDAKAMRGDVITMMMQGFAMGGGGRFPLDLDMEKWPKPEMFEKYIDVSTQAMVNEENGAFYTYFLAFKPQEAAEDE